MTTPGRAGRLRDDDQALERDHPGDGDRLTAPVLRFIVPRESGGQAGRVGRRPGPVGVARGYCGVHVPGHRRSDRSAQTRCRVTRRSDSSACTASPGTPSGTIRTTSRKTATPLGSSAQGHVAEAAGTSHVADPDGRAEGHRDDRMVHLITVYDSSFMLLVLQNALRWALQREGVLAISGAQAGNGRPAPVAAVRPADVIAAWLAGLDDPRRVADDDRGWLRRGGRAGRVGRV
jgi:hypothetical protein